MPKTKNSFIYKYTLQLCNLWFHSYLQLELTNIAHDTQRRLSTLFLGCAHLIYHPTHHMNMHTHLLLSAHFCVSIHLNKIPLLIYVYPCLDNLQFLKGFKNFEKIPHLFFEGIANSSKSRKLINQRLKDQSENPSECNIFHLTEEKDKKKCEIIILRIANLISRHNVAIKKKKKRKPSS